MAVEAPTEQEGYKRMKKFSAHRCKKTDWEKSSVLLTLAEARKKHAGGPRQGGTRAREMQSKKGQRLTSISAVPGSLDQIDGPRQGKASREQSASGVGQPPRQGAGKASREQGPGQFKMQRLHYTLQVCWAGCRERKSWQRVA